MIFLPTYDKQYSEHILQDLKTLVKESDLIGITCTSYASEKAIQVIQCLKDLNIPIVWGGIHATFNPEECLKYADVVCVGEGEEAMLELVEKLEKKKDIRRIKNLWSRKKGKIYKNDVRPLIENLDELPFPDYDFENQWILYYGKLVKLNEEHFRQGEFNQINFLNVVTELKFSKIMLVHTSRGCPHQCTFCYNYTIKKIYKNKGTFVRKRSIKNVIQELVELKHKFPNIDFIWFTDDTFFIRSIEELKFFSKEYKKKIALPFVCYIDPRTFNETKLKILLNANLRRIKMGIQTGSEEINKNIYNRHITNKHIINISKIINKYKFLFPEYQIIIANPYEKEKDVLATVNLLQQLPKPYFLQVHALVFFPGTHLFYKALNDGIIKSKRDTCYNITYGDYTKNFMIKFKKLDTVYLNLILALMERRVTSSRYGLLPKSLLRFLLNKNIIRFFNKFEFPNRILVNFFLPPYIKLKWILN